MEQFETAVLRVLRGLAAGEVVTYGEVALEAGYPGRARAVGRILATTDEAVPWWRVVASNGRLVPDHEEEHTRRLRAEGIELNPRTGRVQLAAVAATGSSGSRKPLPPLPVTAGRTGTGRRRRS